MKSIKLFVTVAAGVLVAGPTVAREANLVDALIKAVSAKRNSAPSAAGPGVSPVLGGGGAFQVTMSPEQAAGLQGVLAAKVANPDVARSIGEARPLIEKLVAIGACSTSKAAWNAINAQSESPATYPNYDWLSVVGGSKYHDKRTCFDTQRVGEWSKPARNALSYIAFFVSGLSGEAARVKFELVKTAEGQWLVRSIALS